MSLHYILDGYNIIHQISGLSSGKLEEQRHKLVRHIENLQPQGSRSNEVTIVFDGRSDIYGDGQISYIKVLYSRDESADEKIKRLAANAENKANTVIVTNDREIQYSVRAVGAKAISVQDFFFAKNQPAKSGIKKSSKSAKDSKDISQVTEFKITSEMEQIWLKKKDQKK